jgi:hypothetical protein
LEGDRARTFFNLLEAERRAQEDLGAEKREKESEIKSLLKLESAELLSDLVQSNLAPSQGRRWSPPITALR